MDNYTHIETSDLTYHLEGQLVAVLRRLDWKTCRCAPKQLHVHVPVGVFTGSYYFFVISAIWQRNAWCACCRVQLSRQGGSQGSSCTLVSRRRPFASLISCCHYECASVSSSVAAAGAPRHCCHDSARESGAGASSLCMYIGLAYISTLQFCGCRVCCCTRSSLTLLLLCNVIARRNST